MDVVTITVSAGAALLVIGGVAYLAAKWWRYWGGRALWLSLPIQQWPDFQKWDDRSEFKLYEAAALWFDAEPRLPMWWRARRKVREWKRTIAGGVELKSQHTIIESLSGSNRSITPHTQIDREVLKKLAQKEGRRPLFLFPERRTARTSPPQ
jgi:hypothetical protein